MPDMSVAMLANTTVCHSKAQVPAEADPATCLPFVDFSVCLETTVLTVCFSYLMRASAFQKNTSTYLYTHPADNW